MSHPRSHCPWEARIPRLESSGNNAAQPTVGSGQDGQDEGAAPKEGDQRGWSSAWSTVPGLPFSLSFFLSVCLSLSLSLSPVSLPSLCLCLSLCIYDGEQRTLRWRTSTRHQTAQTTSCAGQVTGGPAAWVYFLGKGEAAMSYSAWHCGHVPGFATAGHTALPLLLTHLVPGVTDIHSIRT